MTGRGGEVFRKEGGPEKPFRKMEVVERADSRFQHKGKMNKSEEEKSKDQVPPREEKK